MQDIIPPNKRTIRNVPLRKSISTTEHIHHTNHRHEHVEERPIPQPEYEFDEDILESLEKKRSWFFYISAILIPVITIFIFLAIYSIKFSSAEVFVTPKSIKTNISLIINNGEIKFTVFDKSIKKEIEVVASGEERVENKASGQIIIYNRHSTASQTLIKNTRFQTSDGKMYRIQNQVVVPGYKKNGSVIEAGSLEVTVYADSAGEQYNIGLSDFTIPGFKGDPRFETMYARSKTSMTGGFIGIQKKVSEEDIKNKLQESIETFKKEIIAEKDTEETVSLSDTIYFENKELTRTNKDANTVVIEYEINAHAFVFPKKELSRIIVDKTTINEDKTGVYIKNFSTITTETRPAVTPWKSNNVSFTLNGLVDFVWYYDSEKIAYDLAGQNRKNFNTIMAVHKGVKSSETKISPFIKFVFPNDPKKIRVLEK